jgi:inorganic pyrophosphatase
MGFNLQLYFQGTLTAIRDWFRDYKIPDGKPANRFGLGNQAVNKVLYRTKLLMQLS